VLDVFNSLAEVRLLYAPGTLAPRDPKPVDEGDFPRLPGAKTLALTAEGQRFSGRLTVTFGELRSGFLPVQVVYVGRDGRVLHGKPRNHAIAFEGRTPSPDAAAPSLPGNFNGTELRVVNDEFLARSRQDGLVITVTGTAAGGAIKVRSVKIEDGAETFDGA